MVPALSATVDDAAALDALIGRAVERDYCAVVASLALASPLSRETAHDVWIGARAAAVRRKRSIAALHALGSDFAAAREPDRYAAVQQIRVILSHTQAAGAETLVVTPCRSPARADDAERFTLDAKLSLRFDAEMAGVRLGFPILPGTGPSSALAARDLIDAANSWWVGAVLELSTQSPIESAECIEMLSHRLAAVCLDGRTELSDLSPIVAALASVAFSGPFIVEDGPQAFQVPRRLASMRPKA